MYSPDLSHGRVVQKSIKQPQRFHWSVIAAIAFVSVCPLPATGALDPAPDGGYPNNNTAEGSGALNSLTSGGHNTAVGTFALTNTTTPYSNTAIGANAMQNNTTGAGNTATGAAALLQNTGGSGNTATGDSALYNNRTGDANTAIGSSALFSNTVGLQNTATGVAALYTNSNGTNNAATGYRALYNNTSGQSNTAMGAQALTFNTTGSNNTGTGIDALYSNTTGHDNTAGGVNSLLANSSGYFNTASGGYALYTNTAGHDNTGEGFQSLFRNTGSLNVALGSNAGYNLTTGNNNIDIGANVVGAAAESNTIRLGKQGTQQKTLIAGIYGKTVASGIGVIIGQNGQLGTVQSSAVFKEAIKPMNAASEVLLKLKPVTFRYNEELDPEHIPQFGLIAEDVEKVNPDLVMRDEDGKVNTVRYEAVNAMLLNEFLKEHRKVEQQEATIGRLECKNSTVRLMFYLTL